MNLADGRLSPAPGTDGLVARVPGALLFVAARTPADDVARLVDVVQEAQSDAPGRQLARRLALLVGADHDTTLPGFALVAASPGGTYVRAYGQVEVRLVGEDGEEVISAVGTLTGVDRELPGPFHTIVARRAGDPTPAPSSDVDLRAGTVPGSGFALTTVGAPTVAAGPVVVTSAEAAALGATGTAAAATDVADAAPGAGTAEEVPLDEVGPSGTDVPTEAWSPTTGDLAEGDPVAGDAVGPGADEPVEDEPVEDGPVEPAIDVTSDEVVVADATPDDEAIDEPLDAMVVGIPEGGEDDAAGPTDAEVLASEPDTDEAQPDGPALDAPPVVGEPVFATPAGAGDDIGHDHPHEPATLPPAAIPPVDPAAAAPAAFSSVLLGALDNDEVDEREALPVELDPAEVRTPDQEDASEVLVQGVVCSRGHFNDPRSRFCSSCGISMVQNTQVLTQGPRPPLGVMVFEDGATFSLATDYIVGRQPEIHDLVQQGLALPITVDDPERSISRAHAELRLVDWDVHLVNLSGTNGSFVWDETQQQWIPIPEGQSVQLMPGMRVALGRRSAVFESSLVR